MGLCKGLCFLRHENGNCFCRNLGLFWYKQVRNPKGWQFQTWPRCSATRSWQTCCICVEIAEPHRTRIRTDREGSVTMQLCLGRSDSTYIVPVYLFSGCRSQHWPETFRGNCDEASVSCPIARSRNDATPPKIWPECPPQTWKGNSSCWDPFTTAPEVHSWYTLIFWCPSSHGDGQSAFLRYKDLRA